VVAIAAVMYYEKLDTVAKVSAFFSALLITIGAVMIAQNMAAKFSCRLHKHDRERNSPHPPIGKGDK